MFNNNTIELVKIKSIKKSGLRNVVDISVEEDETFCFSNGLISHNSASGLLIASRNPDIHGILPLRGKIMNVSGNEKVTELMASNSLKDIMVSLNLIPGQKADPETLNYGRILIATDSDEDGSNIQALICNFLYKFWPELFQDAENPIVYVFNTPFIILTKGKERKYFYGHEEHLYKPEEWKGWDVTRAKGLGTLTKEDFTDAIYSGYALPIIDDGNMKELLDLLFNSSRADDRKEWMK